jgi:hypothetical protein
MVAASRSGAMVRTRNPMPVSSRATPMTITNVETLSAK